MSLPSDVFRDIQTYSLPYWASFACPLKLVAWGLSQGSGARGLKVAVSRGFLVSGVAQNRDRTICSKTRGSVSSKTKSDVGMGEN